MNDVDTRKERLIEAFAEFVRGGRGEGVSTRSEQAVPDGLLSVADAATYLNVSTTTVRNLAVGGKVRSARVGDRIRFRRVWLDEWIDAGGGDVPPPAPPEEPPAPTAAAPSAPASTAAHARPVAARPTQRRSTREPKPPSFIQRLGDQELRLLKLTQVVTQAWHVGGAVPLCGASGKWEPSLERCPHATMCKTCLTALGAMPDSDLTKFGVGRVYMLRLTHRGPTPTPLRAGFHTGNGRKTLCGKNEGPWALTEREPQAEPCFVCDHRRRWEARDLPDTHLVPRPITHLRVLIDVGDIDERLTALFVEHSGSLEVRQSQTSLSEDELFSPWKHFPTATPINDFRALPGLDRKARGNYLTISDTTDWGTTEVALAQIPAWARMIEKAAPLYAKWAKESRSRR